MTATPVSKPPVQDKPWHQHRREKKMSELGDLRFCPEDGDWAFVLDDEDWRLIQEQGYPHAHFCGECACWWLCPMLLPAGDCAWSTVSSCLKYGCAFDHRDVGMEGIHNVFPGKDLSAYLTREDRARLLMSVFPPIVWESFRGGRPGLSAREEE